jgi:hypothetical protein
VHTHTSTRWAFSGFGDWTIGAEVASDAPCAGASLTQMLQRRVKGLATAARFPRFVGITITRRSSHDHTSRTHQRDPRFESYRHRRLQRHAGDKIGKVEDVVLDKQSNNIMFAVVGFGGFLGMNEKFHPLPWSTLDYQKGQRRLCREHDEGAACRLPRPTASTS